MSPRVVKPGAIGQPFSRVDGRLKTTGKATFAAEYNVDDVTHGALVFSRIARGKIKNIDTRAAATAPGVISVLTHENAPAMKKTAVLERRANSRVRHLRAFSISTRTRCISMVSPSPSSSPKRLSKLNTP